MAEELIGKISDREGVKMLSLFYLTDGLRFDTLVPSRNIAEKYSFHPSSVGNALNPLLEDTYFSRCLESKKIRNVLCYRIKDTKSGRVIKKFFDTLRYAHQ